MKVFVSSGNNDDDLGRKCFDKPPLWLTISFLLQFFNYDDDNEERKTDVNIEKIFP